MKVVNDTPFEYGMTVGMGPERRPCLALILKATFTLPGRGKTHTEPAAEQRPVATEDEYYDGDVTGSLRLENDNAPYKPRTDIACIATAYAPAGRPVTTLDVRLRVGRLQKTLRVFGDRSWLFPSRMVMVPLIGDPRPFTEMPITYEHAFGGTDRKAAKWFAQNPVGKGFLGKKSRESVDGRPLPNVEDPARLISSWDDEPMPAGFGFFNPHFETRRSRVGSHDGAEQPHPVFGLAADFEHAYYNAAHPDLQTPGYLEGDEEVELVHLTADGHRRFRLPGIRPRAEVQAPEPARADEEEGWNGGASSVPQPVAIDLLLDTVVFLPDEDVFTLVWRGHYPLEHRASMDDVARDLEQIGEIRFTMPQDGQGR